MGEEQDRESITEVLRQMVIEGTLKSLPESLRKDRDILSIRESCVAMLEFTKALSKGDLSQELKAKGFLAGYLKSLQANLRHLTWQTGQITKGDFGQRVSFMGEFSEAFNSMVVSLAEARERFHEYERELVNLATTDVLTGIYNRRHFLDVAAHQMEQARRYGRPLSLVLLDIDHFKKVNDTYGHAVGDEVIRHVARIAKNSLRKTDIFARYGGEEFIVLMPETTSGAAFFVSERTRGLIAASPAESGDEKIMTTISFGISAFEKNSLETAGEETTGEETAGLEQLINQADQALYASKNSGRNRTTLFISRNG
jgi:diguanylate cyclase (GGDEF)-like protein